jgi:hypothetical protein
MEDRNDKKWNHLSLRYPLIGNLLKAGLQVMRKWSHNLLVSHLPVDSRTIELQFSPLVTAKDNPHWEFIHYKFQKMEESLIFSSNLFNRVPNTSLCFEGSLDLTAFNWIETDCNRFKWSMLNLDRKKCFDISLFFSHDTDALFHASVELLVPWWFWEPPGHKLDDPIWDCKWQHWTAVYFRSQAQWDIKIVTKWN